MTTKAVSQLSLETINAMIRNSDRAARLLSTVPGGQYTTYYEHTSVVIEDLTTCSRPAKNMLGAFSAANRHGLERSSNTPMSDAPSYDPVMNVTPTRRRRAISAEGISPKVSRTAGQRPSCLVNASVTYCGDNQIYAFGGFDQYTDEGGCCPSSLAQKCIGHG